MKASTPEGKPEESEPHRRGGPRDGGNSDDSSANDLSASSNTGISAYFSRPLSWLWAGDASPPSSSTDAGSPDANARPLPLVPDPAGQGKALTAASRNASSVVEGLAATVPSPGEGLVAEATGEPPRKGGTMSTNEAERSKTSGQQRSNGEDARQDVPHRDARAGKLSRMGMWLKGTLAIGAGASGATPRDELRAAGNRGATASSSTRTSTSGMRDTSSAAPSAAVQSTQVSQADAAARQPSRGGKGVELSADEAAGMRPSNDETSFAETSDAEGSRIANGATDGVNATEASQGVSGRGSASAVAAAAVAAAAAYLPTASRGLEVWQQSWDRSKGDYWAYELGYRLSQQAMSGMTSSLNYAGTWIPWRSSAQAADLGPNAASEGVNDTRTGPAQVEKISADKTPGYDTSMYMPEFVVSGSREIGTSTLRRLASNYSAGTSKRRQAGGASQEALVDSILAPDADVPGNTSAAPRAGERQGRAQKGRGRLQETATQGGRVDGVGTSEVPQDGREDGRAPRDADTLGLASTLSTLGLDADSVYSDRGGVTSGLDAARVLGGSDVRGDDGGDALAAAPDAAQPKRKRDAAKEAAKAAAAALRPGADDTFPSFESSDSLDALDNANDFVKYMQDLAFWRMEWWSASESSDKSNLSLGIAARDAAASQAASAIGIRASDLPELRTAPPPGPGPADVAAPPSFKSAETDASAAVEPWAPWAPWVEGDKKAALDAEQGGTEESWASGLYSLLFGDNIVPTSNTSSEFGGTNSTAQAAGETVTTDGSSQGAAMGELLSGLFDGMSPVAEPRNLSETAAKVSAAVTGSNVSTSASPAWSQAAEAATSAVAAAATASPGANEVSSSFALVSSSTGSLADSLIRVFNSLGLDAGKYEERLADARTSLLQSIGVGGAEPLDGYDPDWASKDIPFDAGMAALLAHAAFESYNDPAGGKWEMHVDGTRSAYLSPDFVRELYQGILMVKVCNLSFDAPTVDNDRQRSWRGGGGNSKSSSTLVSNGRSTKSKKGGAADQGEVAALEWAGGKMMSSASMNSSSKTLLQQQRKGLVRLQLPNCVHAVEAEAGVAVGSDGRVEEARSVLDFQNQSVFMYTSMPRADGQNQGSKDLVIKATVSRTSASSFAYLSSEQQEMVGRAAVSLHKMQGLQSRRLRLPLLGTMPETARQGKTGSGGRQGSSPPRQESAGKKYAPKQARPGMLNGDDKVRDEGECAVQTSTMVVGDGRGPVTMVDGRRSVVWDMGETQVGMWLAEIELGQFSRAFKEKGINGRALVELWELLETDPNFCHHLLREELGIRRLGDTLAFSAELRNLVRVSSGAISEASAATGFQRGSVEQKRRVSFRQGSGDLSDVEGETLVTSPLVESSLNVSMVAKLGAGSSSAADPDAASPWRVPVSLRSPVSSATASSAFASASRSLGDADNDRKEGIAGNGRVNKQDAVSSTVWLKSRLKTLLAYSSGGQVAEEEEEREARANLRTRGQAVYERRGVGIAKAFAITSEGEVEGFAHAFVEPGGAGAEESRRGGGGVGADVEAGVDLRGMERRAVDAEEVGKLELEISYLPFTQGPYLYMDLGLSKSATFARNACWKPMERWKLLRKRAEAFQTVLQASELMSTKFAPARDQEQDKKGSPASPSSSSSSSVSSDSSPDTAAENLQDGPLLKGLGSDPLGEPVCFIEVNATDTHAVIWRDRERKRVVVAFRGTDINWKDVLTDLMCFQTDASWIFEGGAGGGPAKMEQASQANLSRTEHTTARGNSTDKSAGGEGKMEAERPLAHIGFCIAYASCREQLWRVMRKLLPEKGEDRKGWTVCTTGHSLGGALCTLFAAEIAVRFPETAVMLYNFGAPKVGNEEFVRRFNRLVPHTFRVVNDADVIVRLPRNKGVGAVPGAGNYYHVGRTVLISPESRFPVWVEGESPGEDPLSERWDSLSDLLAAEVRLMQTLVDGRGFVQHVEDGYYEAMLEVLRVSEQNVGLPSNGPAGPGGRRVRIGSIDSLKERTGPQEVLLGEKGEGEQGKERETSRLINENGDGLTSEPGLRLADPNLGTGTSEPVM
jgi:hypothetical protein